MGVNESLRRDGTHGDNQSECSGCLEWFDDQVLTYNAVEELLCPGCAEEENRRNGEAQDGALWSQAEYPFAKNH